MSIEVMEALHTCPPYLALCIFFMCPFIPILYNIPLNKSVRENKEIKVKDIDGSVVISTKVIIQAKVDVGKSLNL